MDVKPGKIFKHKRWLDADKSPAICKIFAVRNDAVYFGLESERKAKAWLPRETFVSKAVKTEET